MLEFKDKELTVRKENLPTTAEGLSLYIAVGKEKLKARQAEIRAYNKVDAADTAKKAILNNAQLEAESLLEAEAKLGELLAGIPKPKFNKIINGSLRGTTESLPPTITKKQSHQAQTISRNPEIVKQVITEAKEKDLLPTSQQVYREVKRKEQKTKHTEIQKNTPSLPEGKYEIIVIDPPWPIKKIVREVRPNQTEHLDYPTMSVEEIQGIKIPYADNCHLFLWATQKFLPDSFRILDEWGFKYVCTFGWHKPGGFQPVGLPQYNLEFVVYGRRGTPRFRDTKNFNLCFRGARGRHSEKPETFYETIRRVTAGRRVDMFGRRKFDGFESWGNEAK